ncbi:MAG: hypothetical protein IJ796_08940 [Lachnospiraceae bacterium]|nr:hypothetical protein [Lachnospiraceae bacterium]
MESVKKSIKVPAIISLAVEGAVTTAELLVLALQDKLYPIFIGNIDITKGTKVFPPSFILSILQLALYIVFVYLIFNYKGDRRRAVSIVLIVISLVLMGLSYPVSRFYLLYLGHVWGTAYIAMASGVQSMMGAVSAYFGFVAAPLFYIACGRYGVSGGYQVNGNNE